MRILHFADIHIGVENYGRIDPDSGLSTRLQDFLRSFDEVVSYAINTGIDLVLFAGDAYKSRDPSQTHQREFAKRIARLSSAGIPVFLLVGNHDTPHVIGRATSLEIFNTLDVPKVYTGDRVATYVVQTASGPLQIVAVPWIRRSGLLTRDDTRGLSPGQVNELIQERLSQMIKLEASRLDRDIPAVLAGHVSVSDARTSSETFMMLGRDHVLLMSNVALPDFDYVALGHIHKHQILRASPHVVYSGSLERVDFGEENDEKGFCVVELEAAGLPGMRFKDFNFVKVNARPFLTIDVSISYGDTNPMNTVLDAISKETIAGAVVRVRIEVSAELEGHLRESEIRAALSSAHFVASISKQIKGESRTRLGAASSALEPKEALALYLQNRGVSDDRAKVLMGRAEELMNEST